MLRKLFAGLSRRGPYFDPTSVHVWFVVEKVALGQFFLLVLRFSLVGKFHQCSMLISIYMLLLKEGQMGKARKPSKSKALSEIGEHWTANHFHFFLYGFQCVKRRFIYKFTFCLFESVACLLSHMEGHFNNNNNNNSVALVRERTIPLNSVF